ncbi:uncharacterized protein LOC124209368 [Daphnia pulex]|uniref:uncharacterized protein LOC124209368 n=1 Tax=Daphnia pulex TaxID=6669 RepID=UPI001EE019FD|nr:uncharacterized protein LOC124209368 [Daphnia pulex]
MDYFQIQYKILGQLFENARDNASEIVRIYFTMIGHKDFQSSNLIYLNQKAVLLLSTEVVDVLKNNRLDAFSYLLVANNLLDLEDVKEDLLNGDVLVKAKATPSNSIRRLKAELGLATSPMDQIAAVPDTPKPISQQQQVPENASVAPTVPDETSHPINQQQQPKEDATATDPRENIQCQSKAAEGINRLPFEIQNECTGSTDVEGVTLYKLKLTQVPTYTESSSMVKRFSFGEPILPERTRKTILLMGATGSGKTTMINAMINYILGVEWDDPFRFILVDEELRGASQANSQTQGVTAYDLHYRSGFRIPFSLTIVDTPGFGDTGGMDRDKEITSAIQEFFKHQNGIQELDAVGFVVQSSLVRLTASQKYIFNSVLSIFGKDIEENIRFLVTFSDGRQPLVLDAIKEAELPCRMDSKGLPSHQKFNNGAVFISQSDEDDMSPVEWKNAMKNFKLFFEEINEMPTKSLQMTNQVLEDREQLEIYLDFMLGGIEKQLMKMDELRKTKDLVAINREKIQANQNFEMSVPVSKKVKMPTADLAMNCTKCETTCHYPCEPSLLTGFCSAFWKPEGIRFQNDFIVLANTLLNAAKNLATPKCKICPGRCSDGLHQNEHFKWTFIQVEEMRMFHDIRNNYEDAMKKKMDAEMLVKAVETEVEKLKEETIKNMNGITYLHNKLKAIALHGNPLSTFEYIQMMVDNAERDQKPGCREKIENLKELLELAKNNGNNIDDDEKFIKQFTSLNSSS